MNGQPSATIGARVVIEPDVIVGPHCVVGEGTRLRTRSILLERVTMGAGNDVWPLVVLGGDPQDRSFKPDQPGEVIIGDRNIFREGVTINRSNWNGGPTRVGSGCFLMAQSHLGHNAQIGDSVTMANCSCLAGHTKVGNSCVLSAYAGIHQFVELGEGVMVQGGGAATMHVPPFVILSSTVNNIAGLNTVGLRRMAGVTPADRADVRRVYGALIWSRGARPHREVIDELLASGPLAPAAMRFVEFVKRVLALEKPRNRGLCGVRVSRKRRFAEVQEDAAV